MYRPFTSLAPPLKPFCQICLPAFPSALIVLIIHVFRPYFLTDMLERVIHQLKIIPGALLQISGVQAINWTLFQHPTSVQPVRCEIKIMFAFSKELPPSMQYEASSLSIDVELNLNS